MKGDTIETNEQSNNWFVWRVDPEPYSYEIQSTEVSGGWNLISSSLYGKIEVKTGESGQIEAVYRFNSVSKEYEFAENDNNGAWIVKKNGGAWIKLSKPSTLVISSLIEPRADFSSLLNDFNNNPYVETVGLTENEKHITAKVVHKDISGGFYGLEGTGENGTNYLPLNIQDELSFYKDKTIKVTAYEKLTNTASIYMWGVYINVTQFVEV